MGNPIRVAIYARISSDSEGTGLGVKRQVADCWKLAAQLGWTVVDEYVDNDVSAYSGNRRPEYQRMLADVADGLRDGVLCYHIDRLTRRPLEWEEFAQAMDAAKLRNVRFVVGNMDMGTGDGLMIARMMGAMAANESETKSRRIARKMQERAEAGLPHRAARAFGYEPDGVTIRESEAAMLREVVARYLAGEPVRSLCKWMDEQGMTTPSGSEWPDLRACANTTARSWPTPSGSRSSAQSSGSKCWRPWSSARSADSAPSRPIY